MRFAEARAPAAFVQHTHEIHDGVRAAHDRAQCLRVVHVDRDDLRGRQQYQLFGPFAVARRNRDGQTVRGKLMADVATDEAGPAEHANRIDYHE